MEDHEKQARHSSLPRWLYVVGACVALAILYLYKLHPQTFGAMGSTWLLLGLGCLFTFWTVSNLRSGSATLIYSSFKRGDDSTGFWVAIVVEAAIAVTAFVVVLGTLLGLWHS